MSVEKKSIAKWIWWQFMRTWPLFVAATLTFIFGVWVSDLASEVVQNAAGVSMTRWEQFRAGEPNTMGDTLAGFIGSLTLIWVVASVIQQSMELRAQRREFSEMVRAQDAQVSALSAQADIFLDEKRRRDEAEYQSESMARLQAIWTIMNGDQIALATWFLDRTSENKAPRQNSVALITDIRSFAALGPFDGIPDFRKRLDETTSELEKSLSFPLLLTSSPDALRELRMIVEHILEIERIHDSLPRSGQVTINSLNLSRLRQDIMKFMNNPKFWLECKGN